MSIRAFTDDSAALYARIRKLIDQGHITTWAYDSDGDFTHTPTQWKNKAWLRPNEQSDKLRLTIISPKLGANARGLLGYHGRFIEMLSAHVSNKYTAASATTANPANDEQDLQD